MVHSFLLSAKLRPRFLISITAACCVFAVIPGSGRLSSRLLVAWDSGILLYLGLAAAMMARSGPEMMRQRARREDESAMAFLLLSLGASVASLGAIAAELAGIHDKAGTEQAARLGLAAVTILLSWAFVNLIFAIHYAHDYYGGEDARRGLDFPGHGDPDYWDFLYFSVTIGAAAQTSDVTIPSRRMRRLVLGHTVLAFLFNTTILALAINVAAGLL
jgi:uncharacterized membrane protein